MMYPEFKKFVNLIGHDITISGHGTLPKSENPCFVKTKQRIIGKIIGIPIIFNGSSLARKTPNEYSLDGSLGELSVSIINNFLFKTNIILI